MRSKRSEEELAPLLVDAGQWCVAPSEVALCDGEVHVWLADLTRIRDSVEHFRALLSADEHARAARFHFDKDRNAYITARGILRTLLGRYVGCPACDIEFQYGERGKPALAGQFAEHPLRFNLSHSGAAAVCAFSLGHDTGVDVERIRADFAGEKIARRFFSAAEVDALLALPNEARVQAFFNCWTRKEAFIKAIGEGLSFPLDEFDVALAPDLPAALLATRSEPLEAREWSIHDIKPPEGYAGAVAVKCPNIALRCWRWTETPGAA